MKARSFFAAPYLMISLFLLILISGEHWGGFYLIYLLLALPHGGIHALLAFSGIAFLLFAYRYLSWRRYGRVKLSLYIVGSVLLAGSLMTFFHNDKGGYNDATFDQAVPLASFILSGTAALLFLGINIWEYSKLANGFAADSQ